MFCCDELCRLLCVFGCITCCGCRDHLCRKLVFFPPPVLYEFYTDDDDDEKLLIETRKHVDFELIADGKHKSRVIMSLLDTNGSRIFPYRSDSFLCMRVNTARGESLAAYFISVPKAHFTIMFSHGNATDIGYMRDHLMELSSNLGVNVLAYDYSGYGLSSGQPSIANVFSDIEAIYDYAVKILRLDPSTIIAYGQSLGGGPTAHISASREVAGTVLHSCFTSGLRVIRSDVQSTWFFDIFPNIDVVAQIKTPVFIIHGTDDNEIPIEHGLQLAQVSNREVEPWWVEGAGHNNIEMDFRHEYFNRIRKFLTRLEKRRLQ